MKIAFILSYPVLTSTSGVVSQSITWKKGLNQLGHDVELIDMWKKNEWETFDIIHIFNFNQSIIGFIKSLSKTNPNIVMSPILDPDYSIIALKLYSHWGANKLRVTNPYYELRKAKEWIKGYFVRSVYEKNYMVDGIGIDESKCIVVPLAYGISYEGEILKKEPFCLHVSLLADYRKNVKRLIDAADKYQFRLVLGGKLRNEEEKKLLKKWLYGKKNIEYIGYLSDKELLSLYSKAKVFALPSLNEGVGIVALEAASSGCDIVITKEGGPKEYYNGMASIVNPHDMDQIGVSVREFIEGKTYQPQLQKHIRENYSLQKVCEKLVESYKFLG